MYIAKSNGEIDVWDFTSKSDELGRLCGCAGHWLRQILAAPEEKKGQLLAVGDAAGVLHVMRLPRSLRRAVNGEKDRMEEGFLSARRTA